MGRSRVFRAGGFASAVALFAGIAGLGAAGSAPAQDPAERGGTGRPNFVVIETDDQPLSSFNRRVMPFTRRKIASKGTVFENAITTSPLCCPSRAGFLTGSYTHNHGAWNSYVTFEDPANMLAAWLGREGYRTAMVGKYLNHYDRGGPDTRPERGWDEWRMLLSPLSYYDYDVSVNGRRVQLGDSDSAYQTSYLNREATQLTRRWSRKSKPFFLWLTPHAPHDENGRSSKHSCAGKAVPAPGDEDLFRNADLPRPPSFNESAIDDKPAFMRRLDKLDRDQVKAIEANHRCRLASLREVDRGVQRIYGTLKRERELDNTIIVFTTDNGLFQGEHRLAGGKRLPYSEAVEVPLVAHVPNALVAGSPPGRISAPVAQIDLAPTFLELAGGDPCLRQGDCRTMDGRSLVPLLERRGGAWPDDRGLLVEMHNCRYRAIRASDQLYVEHHSTPRTATRTQGCRHVPATERYDLADDPFQLRNLGAGGTPPALRDRLHDLRNCAGIEGRDPATPGASGFCE